MSTDLPYAADAQVSLSYDELEVCILLIPSICITQHSAAITLAGPPITIKELTQLHVTIQTTFNYTQGLVTSPIWKSWMQKRDRGAWQQLGEEACGVEFKSLTGGSPSSSGQPLVHLTDLARQLRYVALVTFNVGFDITNIDVEVELDVRCHVIRGEADEVVARLMCKSEVTIRRAMCFCDAMSTFHLL